MGRILQNGGNRAVRNALCHVIVTHVTAITELDHLYSSTRYMQPIISRVAKHVGVTCCHGAMLCVINYLLPIISV